MLTLFFKVIAILFLILFFIKLFNPKVFPIFRKAYQTVFDFIIYTFKLLIKSSIYTIHLLFNRTVYVIGLDIIFALLFNIVLTFVVYPHFDLKIWYTLFKGNLLNSYVISFFVCTYLIGLYQYLKVKKNFKLPFIFLSKFNKTQKKGFYTYNDQSKEYTYHDERK